MKHKKELRNSIHENIAYQQHVIKVMEEQIEEKPCNKRFIQERQNKIIFLQSCVDEIDALFKSLTNLVELAKNDTSASKVTGQFLLGIYNSSFSNFSTGKLRLLDDNHWWDAINVLRLERLNYTEIHQYLEDGHAIFHQMVEDWGE